MSGLMVEVYRGAGGGDCTNGGASSKFSHFIFTWTDDFGEAVPGPFEPRPDMPELVMVIGPQGSVRAVPRELVDAKKWVMFGGNFCFTSDSRFPSGQPIKIFDRVED